jgi:hypothetical protein
MEKNVLKSSPLKPVSQYSKHVIGQKRRLLNNFPIGSYVKTMSADGGHFEPRSGSLNTILAVDHLRTIDNMFAILAHWFQRRRQNCVW